MWGGTLGGSEAAPRARGVVMGEGHTPGASMGDGSRQPFAELNLLVPY